MATGRATNRARVAIALRDPAVRQTLAAALDADGYEVWAARGAAELHALLASVRADVATDLLIMDGSTEAPGASDVVALVRALPLRVPVIFVGPAPAARVAAELSGRPRAAQFDRGFALGDLRTVAFWLSPPR